MTLLRAAKPRTAAPASTRAYAQSFVVQVHRLLAAAFDRLRATDLAKKEETAITGLLASAMREVIEGPERLPWASRFAVHDDPPIATPEREGRARLRLDIQIERTDPGMHPRFPFEAKRLNRSDSVAEYVGEEGLGAFVTGIYAATHDTVGMLAYVQIDDGLKWAARIENKLETNRRAHGLGTRAAVWTEISFAGTNLLSYESSHQRRVSPVRVIHTFLPCR